MSWPSDKDDADAFGSRRAIIDAQWLKLIAHDPKLGFICAEPMAALLPFAAKAAGKIGVTDWSAFTARDLDQVQAALGRRVRALLAGERRHGTEVAA